MVRSFEVPFEFGAAVLPYRSMHGTRWGRLYEALKLIEMI